MSKTITTAELADELDTTPRTLRKFLRADAKVRGAETPGKGSRYALPADARSIKALTKRFTEWTVAQAAKAESDETPDED